MKATAAATRSGGYPIRTLEQKAPTNVSRHCFGSSFVVCQMICQTVGSGQPQAARPHRAAAERHPRHRLEGAAVLRALRHLVAAGKAKVVVTTAIAREMVGFIWAIARQVCSSSRQPDRWAAHSMPRAGDRAGWGTLVRLL